MLVLANLRITFLKARPFRREEDFEDCFQEAVLGLVEATNKVDRRYRRCRFFTYAIFHVKRRLIRWLRSRLLIRPPFGLPLDSLEPDAVLLPEVPTPEAPDQIGHASVRHDCDRSLADLPERQRFVLRRRFGIGTGDGPQTLDSIGQYLGISREMVRRIEAKALKRLRHPKRAAMLIDHYVDS